jgi:hypothetical protein
MGTPRDTDGLSEHHATEFAVMAPAIEQFPDRSGFLKFPSQPAWIRVSFPYFDVPKVAEPFVANGKLMSIWSFLRQFAGLPIDYVK